MQTDVDVRGMRDEFWRALFPLSQSGEEAGKAYSEKEIIRQI